MEKTYKMIPFSLPIAVIFLTAYTVIKNWSDKRVLLIVVILSVLVILTYSIVLMCAYVVYVVYLNKLKE